jgi:hypothetical protein
MRLILAAALLVGACSASPGPPHTCTAGCDEIIVAALERTPARGFTALSFHGVVPHPEGSLGLIIVRFHTPDGQATDVLVGCGVGGCHPRDQE